MITINPSYYLAVQFSTVAFMQWYIQTWVAVLSALLEISVLPETFDTVHNYTYFIQLLLLHFITCSHFLTVCLILEEG